MTQVTSAHLGESLGTDFFSVREQFTDEQWDHFITVRRFVDEEVVPVVGPYWERAEICWPGRGRPADPHRGRAGQDAQHPQGPRDRRRRTRHARRQRHPARLPGHAAQVDMEAIHTFEGTETMQTLIVGRAITGIGAFT
jgi:hypothetical protein